MLSFIGWQGQQIDGFLDTDERVAEARKTLENSTEELFERLKIAKINSWSRAHEIVLD